MNPARLFLTEASAECRQAVIFAAMAIELGWEKHWDIMREYWEAVGEGDVAKCVRLDHEAHVLAESLGRLQEASAAVRKPYTVL
jgi:hypothetical protein